MPIGGHFAVGDGLNGFVDGVEPPFCLVGAGHCISMVLFKYIDKILVHYLLRHHDRYY
jgi:hypothetical protein